MWSGVQRSWEIACRSYAALPVVCGTNANLLFVLLTGVPLSPITRISVGVCPLVQ